MRIIKMNFLYSCLWSLILLFAGGGSLQAQKIEHEKRIPPSAFPKSAIQYLNSKFPESRKVKLYKETSTDSITYEAKFKWEKDWYSVEFLPQGDLLDIEKQIKFKDVPEKTRQRIIDYWDKSLKKFKVTRCQEQTSDEGIRYEIEIKEKNEEETAYFEYLFEKNGDFIQKRKIVLRSTDMTLY